MKKLSFRKFILATGLLFCFSALAYVIFFMEPTTGLHRADIEGYLKIKSIKKTDTVWAWSGKIIGQQAGLPIGIVYFKISVRNKAETDFIAKNPERLLLRTGDSVSGIMDQNMICGCEPAIIRAKY